MTGNQIELFASPAQRIEAFIKFESEPRLDAETHDGRRNRVARRQSPADQSHADAGYRRRRGERDEAGWTLHGRNLS